MTVLDNGEPTLRSTSRVVVRILDVNDNPPVFSHKLFNVRLPERLNPVTPGPVYRLVASDLDEGLNGRVTYSIEESDEEGFSIDPVTGVVSSSSTFTAGEYNILTVRGVCGGTAGQRCSLRTQRETAFRHNGTPLRGFFPEKLQVLTSAKRSEFWAFLSEGNKVLAWEIYPILKDLVRGAGAVKLRSAWVPFLVLPFYTCVALDKLTPVILGFIICKMRLRTFS